MPAGIYLLKANKGNDRTICEICLKLIIKIPERDVTRRFSVFIVDFEQVSNIGMVFPLLTLSI